MHFVYLPLQVITIKCTYISIFSSIGESWGLRVPELFRDIFNSLQHFKFMAIKKTYLSSYEIVAMLSPCGRKAETLVSPALASGVNVIHPSPRSGDDGMTRRPSLQAPTDQLTVPGNTT